MTASISRYRQQTGSVLVQFALLLGIIVAILGVLDIGYMYYAKRELQRTADLAALQAVHGMAVGGARVDCEQAGVESVRANWLSNSPITPVVPIENSVVCGAWDSSSYKEPTYFQDGGAHLNAAQVVLKGETPTFFPGTWSRGVEVYAIAKREEPQAVFSVGSKLLSRGRCGAGLEQLDELSNLLSLLGVGQTCVVLNGYEGLVNLQIDGVEKKATAGQLLTALGLPLEVDMTVLDVNELLAANKVSLGELLNATAFLAGNDQGVLQSNAKLINALSAKLKIDAFSLLVPLGAGLGGVGLFSGIKSDSENNVSALNMPLNIMNIISTAVAIGTSKRGLDVPGLEIGIPGILPNVLKVRAGITEPPSIAMGSSGTTAYNAQTRLYIDVDTGNGILGGLLRSLNVQIKLPIFIDLSRAKVTLGKVNCAVPYEESSAEFIVERSIAQLCIGKVTGDPFSTSTPICESLDEGKLITALGLIELKNKVKLDVLGNNKNPDPLEVKLSETFPAGGVSLNFSATFSNVLNEIFRLLMEPRVNIKSLADNEESAKRMANYLLGVGADAHPEGVIPKNKIIGLTSGIYDLDKLTERLIKEIPAVDEKKCVLVFLLCKASNFWDGWGDRLKSLAAPADSSCRGKPYEEVVDKFLSLGPDAIFFNECVEKRLKEALLKPSSEQVPNYLPVLLKPIVAVLGKILEPVGMVLDNVLQERRGIELGGADVSLNSLSCSSAVLVY